MAACCVLYNIETIRLPDVSANNRVPPTQRYSAVHSRQSGMLFFYYLGQFRSLPP